MARIIHTLIAQDASGQTLGTIEIDDIEQRYITVWNHPHLGPQTLDAHRNLTDAFDFIERDDNGGES